MRADGNWRWRARENMLSSRAFQRLQETEGSKRSAAIGSAMVAVTIYFCYGFADRLADVMRTTGMNVILSIIPSWIA
jgi:hypothetical protein